MKNFITKIPKFMWRFKVLWNFGNSITAQKVTKYRAFRVLQRQKLSLNHIMSLNRIILCIKLKNGLCKIATKAQVVTKFNVTWLYRDWTVPSNDLQIRWMNSKSKIRSLKRIIRYTLMAYLDPDSNPGPIY